MIMIMIVIMGIKAMLMTTIMMMIMTIQVIQKLLDKCLLDDDEMQLGPRGWLEKFDCVDKIRLPAIRFVNQFGVEGYLYSDELKN